MRWLVRAALLLTVLLATAPALAQPRQPALRLLDRTPLVVRGLNFRTGERVRVVVLSESGESQRVAATSLGSFTARFDEVRVGRCEALLVRAAGSHGSVAVLKLSAPACLPAKRS